jgi:hypothetical protein
MAMRCCSKNLSSISSPYYPAQRGCSKSDLDHSVPNSVRVLARVNIDSSQNCFHRGSKHIVRRSSESQIRTNQDMSVQPNPASNFGQIGVATNGTNQSVADT